MRMKHFKLVLVIDTTYEYNKINMIQSMKPEFGYFKPDILIGMVAERVLESECKVIMVRNRYITKHSDDVATPNPVINAYLKDLQDRLIETLIEYLPHIPKKDNYFTYCGYIDVNKTTITITIEDGKL